MIQSRRKVFIFIISFVLILVCNFDNKFVKKCDTTEFVIFDKFSCEIKLQ